MPVATLNGIRLSYAVSGEGPLVVLVMGSGSPGRVWDLHQTPALEAAGYRVARVDNRGIAPSDECPEGFTIADMAADTAALIEHLGSPAAVVGTSLGARITQELALTRPELVSRAVLFTAHARLRPAQAALSAAEAELAETGQRVSPRYSAAVTAALNLSPRTLADPSTCQEWLDVLEFSAATGGPGTAAQLRLDNGFDRRSAYRGIRVPTMVVAFADDRVIDPQLCREVADAIPGCRYEVVADAGHFGLLERPEPANALLLEFLSGR
ncbi:alpha/beta fold hydrolase [Rhodococcus sp. X156]|uniref:alpha/beta fold hydrolase n=1 Tax=Rhodococcus sp. X156 TaxID=2499145 RepID=UPI000FD75771|nr:alpha/beta fold hydrolase [Rhodococcus sp. X156]